MLAGFDAKPLKRAARRQAMRARASGLTGVIEMYGGDAAPDGALLCTGTAVSRQVYADLFARIGTKFGAGDGVTTFNLPNIRDRMPVGAGSLYSVGATGGSKDSINVAHTHTITDPTHFHGVTDPTHRHTWGANTQNGTSLGSGNAGDPTGSTGTVTSFSATGISINAAATGISVNSSGASGVDANLPPYVGVNFIIWT